MSYQSTRLALSPDVAVWHDEPSGTTVVDYAAVPHDGLYLNSPTLGATGPLTGHSAFVALPGSAESYLNGANYERQLGYTIEAIFKATADDFSNAAWLVNPPLRLFSSGRIAYYDSGSLVFISDNDTVVADTFTHVAVTVDGSGNIVLYVNGTSVKTGTTADVSGTGPLLIGNGATTAITVGPVTHYPTALSSGNISALYAAAVADGLGGAGDTTPPTSSSCTVASNGTTVTFGMSEATVIGTGGNGGAAINMSGGATTLTYASGSGTTSLVYTSSRTITTSETETGSKATYTQPGDGWEDAAGNDVVTFTGHTITNSSTQPDGPPGAPSGLAAYGGSGSVVLTWTQGSGTVANNKIYRSTSSGTETLIDTISAATSYVDTGRSVGTTYFYKVAASNVDGDSSQSGEASATPRTVQYLSTAYAAIRACALAGGSQWTNFAAYLQANFDTIGAGEYEGSKLIGLPTYLAGYVGYSALSDTTNANKCADKAIGLMRYGLFANLRNDSGTRIILGLGNGANAAFTIPDSGYHLATLKVYLLDVVNTAVTKGAANGVDDIDGTGNPYNLAVRISDTSGGPEDYVRGVDWQYGVVTDPFGENKIDWSLGGSEPSPSATYYIAVAQANQNVGPQLRPADYTVSGTTITFVTPPATGKAIVAEYIYDTVDNDYQLTVDERGYQNAVAIDSGGYVCRYLNWVAMGYDWLYGYADFASGLKTACETLMVQWFDWINAHGYAWAVGTTTPNHAIESNYGAGEYSMLIAQAIALMGRGATWPTLLGDAVSFHTTYCLPIFAAPSGRIGTSHGGFWAEGYNYASQAVRLMLLTEQAINDAGLGSNAESVAWTNDFITTVAHHRMTDTTIYPGGDNYSLDPPNQAFPGKDVLYIASNLATDSTAKAVGNWLIQNVPQSAFDTSDPTLNFWDVAYRDPAASATDPASVLPLAAQADGTGLVESRKDWTYGSTQIFYHCGNMSGAGHYEYAQGSLTVNRGADQLMVLYAAVTGDQTAQAKSHYNSLVLFDSVVGTPTNAATASNTTLTLANNSQYTFTSADTGRYVSGSGIPLGTTIAYVNATTATLSQAATATASGVTISITDPAVMTYPGGYNTWAPCQAIEQDWYAPAGCSQTFGRGTTYAYSSGDYAASWEKSDNTQNVCALGQRSVLHVGDYVFVYDRAETAQATYKKQLQWSLMGVPTVVGDAWVSTSGSSKLFAKTFSSATLATTTGSVTNGNTVNLVFVNPTTPTAAIRYVTALQSAASATVAMDSSARIIGTNTLLEGAKLGNTVAMFGRDGAVSADESYSFTATNGATVTHYVADLTPSTDYTLTGANQGSATTTSAGVLTFTTTGTGSPQTVTLGEVVITTPITIGSANIPVDGSVAYADFVTHGGGNLTGLDTSKLRLYRGAPLVLDSAVTVTQSAGLELSFTPTTPFADAEPVAISGDVGAITDANGDPLTAFTNFAVTNATDTTPPTVAAAAINATALTVTLSEAIDAGGSTFAGFSISGTSATIGTPVFSGDRVLTFPVSGTLARTDAVKLAYNATTGTVLDAAGNEMISFSNLTVTNRLNGNKRAVVLLRPPFRFARLRATRRT